MLMRITLSSLLTELLVSSTSSEFKIGVEMFHLRVILSYLIRVISGSHSTKLDFIFPAIIASQKR